MPTAILAGAALAAAGPTAPGHLPVTGAAGFRGVAFLIACGAGGAILALLWHDKAKRLRSFLLAAVAFLIAISVTVWTDALASLVHSYYTLGGLAFVTIGSGFCFWHMVFRGHKHHHVLTPVLAVTFGTSLVLFIGSIGTIIRAVLTSPAAFSVAFGSTVSRVNSGKAAQSAAAAGTGHIHLILALGAGALLALAALAHKLKTSGRSRSSGSAPPRPAAAAPPAAGTRGGRPAIGTRR